MDFSDKLSGLADLKGTVDRGSAGKFGSNSGLCMSRSSDYESDHYFFAGLVRYFGRLSVFQFQVSLLHEALNYNHRQKYWEDWFISPFPPLPPLQCWVSPCKDCLLDIQHLQERWGISGPEKYVVW